MQTGQIANKPKATGKLKNKHKKNKMDKEQITNQTQTKRNKNK